jgi:hypothetical protein
MGRHAMPPSLTRRICRRTALPIAIGVVGMGVFGPSQAFAFWRTSGSGSGESANNTPAAVTIATNATPATGLQPGSSGDFVVSVSNPNAFDVTLTALSITGASGCTDPALSLTGSGLPLTIAANANAVRKVLANAVQMGAGATNDCQGATLTLNLTATVER